MLRWRGNASPCQRMTISKPISPNSKRKPTSMNEPKGWSAASAGLGCTAILIHRNDDPQINPKSVNALHSFNFMMAPR